MPVPEMEEKQFKDDWHALQAEAVLKHLEVRNEGLSTEEVERRLEKYGPNQLKEAPRPGFLTLLWGQLNNFVVILLIVASVISALLGDYVEAAAIMAIVVLNSVLGIIQEQRAEQALAALKKLAAPDAQVMRNGVHSSVPAYNLVPGDIVFLEAGHFVPADLRLLEAVNLHVEEASLTGESLPVQKNAATVLEKNVPLGDRKNTAFMGTLVSSGRGRGVVTSTGMHTQLGLIATMLQNVEAEETPLQKRLDQLGRSLSIGSLVLVAVVFIVALINYTNISELLASPLAYIKEFAAEITEVFIVAISLAIAAVPEGLPAVVTISLALGMREMIQRHALIRRLSSVETLGSATTICSDKTGTLTQNEMTVTRVWADGQFINLTGTGYSPNGEFQVDGKTVDARKYPAVLSTLWLGLINNDASLFHSRDNTCIVIVGKNHVSGFLSHIRPRNTHRYANIGTFDGRRIVHTVSCHCHNFVIGLQRVHDAHFMFGGNTGKDIGILDNILEFIIVEMIDLRAGHHLFAGAQQSNLFSHCPGRIGIITGDHDRANTSQARMFERRLHLDTRWIDHAHQPNKDEIFFQFIGIDLFGVVSDILFRAVGKTNHTQGVFGHHVIGSNDSFSRLVCHRHWFIIHALIFRA